MLNKRGASPRLGEDGIFGPRTQAAVTAFQRAQRVTPANGSVGPGTWIKFGSLTEKLHPVTAFAQPTNMTCWSAAATIIVGNMSVGPGNAALADDGGLAMPLDNVEAFVRGLGWRIVNNQTAPPEASLISALRTKPLWVAFQGGDFAHAVVMSGYYTDGAGSTVFRIHDPWPPNSGTGSVYGTPYHDNQVVLRSISPPKKAMIAYVAQA
ncbi:MAG: peptidoglycan-binding protein [Bryobacterales bacterium]|nr:peptidoglycan-binding protein [Bryobacterales bacterium]